MTQKAVATKTSHAKSSHKSLEIFIGKWREAGQAFDSPFGPAAKVASVQTWEWLPGEMFLVHRLNGHLGVNEISCIEVISANTTKGSHEVHSFYNDGNQNLWHLREHDDYWQLSGEWDTMKARATMQWGDGGRNMTVKWEYQDDESQWQTFWDSTLMRD